MNTLNTICTVLTVVFAAALLFLLVQILYVVWRRRRFRGRTLSSSSVVEFGGDSFYSSPSKELLYFFCWKNQVSRIEPDSTSATAPPHPTAPPPTDAEVEEMIKLQGLYGPSRILFTIREEEREEMEAENPTPPPPPPPPPVKEINDEERMTPESVLTEEPLEVIDIDDATPFSTPCGSPPYYTPTTSPPRHAYLGDDDRVVLRREQLDKIATSCENTTSFVSIDVHTT